jgi:hypothetical protein
MDSCLAVYEADLYNPFPGLDKTTKHEAISRLGSSAFVQNKYFGKIRLNFVLKEQRQDRAPCFVVLSRVKIIGSIFINS